MSKNDLKFRWNYFWYVFGVWMHGILTHRPPKGMVVKKCLITYGIVRDDGIQTEYHEGTIWEFIKWIVTHEPF